MNTFRSKLHFIIFLVQRTMTGMPTGQSLWSALEGTSSSCQTILIIISRNSKEQNLSGNIHAMDIHGAVMILI